MNDLTNLPRTLEILKQGREMGLHLGVQIYVSLAGEVIADTGFGESQPGVAMTPETINLWFSSGKPLTVFAIGNLKEQGELLYDDSLGTHLPEWTKAGQPSVTLHQLLTHQAGFRNDELEWSEHDWDRLIAQIIERPVSGESLNGQRAGYVIASSWFLLGEILVRQTNLPFAQVFRQMIAEPLGLTSTWNGMSLEQYESIADRLGRMYESSRNSKLIDIEWHRPNRVCASSPGGNTYGPIRELGRFYELMLNKGRLDERQVLSVEEVRNFTTRHRTDLFDETFQHKIDWGLGFALNSNRYGAETVPYGFGRFASEGTFGHGGSQSSIGFADPERQLVVAWIANGRPGEPRHQRRNRAINEAIYQDLGFDQ